MTMLNRFAALILVCAVVTPAAAFSQTLNPPLGVQSQNPAGLTLVPGTVAVPGVSGAANTGTIPLPGTSGSPGIVTTPDTSTGVAGALYPPAYYSLVPAPGITQSTLPQNSGVSSGATVTTPALPPSPIPTCLNVRYRYLCDR
jgi:hypothetical protein